MRIQFAITTIYAHLLGVIISRLSHEIWRVTTSYYDFFKKKSYFSMFYSFRIINVFFIYLIYIGWCDKKSLSETSIFSRIYLLKFSLNWRIYIIFHIFGWSQQNCKMSKRRWLKEKYTSIKVNKLKIERVREQ